MNKRKKLIHDMQQEILYEMDLSIINELNAVTTWMPEPDDVIGIFITSLRQELAEKLSGGVYPVCYRYTITFHNIIISGLDEVVRVETKNCGYKDFSYCQPDLVPRLIAWVKRKLREERAFARKHYESHI